MALCKIAHLPVGGLRGHKRPASAPSTIQATNAEADRSRRNTANQRLGRLREQGPLAGTPGRNFTWPSQATHQNCVLVCPQCMALQLQRYTLRWIQDPYRQVGGPLRCSHAQACCVQEKLPFPRLRWPVLCLQAFLLSPADACLC